MIIVNARDCVKLNLDYGNFEFKSVKFIFSIVNLICIEGIWSKIELKFCKIDFHLCKIKFHFCVNDFNMCKIRFQLRKIGFHICKMEFHSRKIDL